MKQQFQFIIFYLIANLNTITVFRVLKEISNKKLMDSILSHIKRFHIIINIHSM